MRESKSKKFVYDVTCAGHLCLDITPAFADRGNLAIEEILKPGTLVKVGPAQVSTGGSVSNSGIGLKILGLRVAFMTLVGRDDFGRVAASILARHGMSQGLATTDQASTSYSIVISPPGIDRFFIHDPGANNLFSSEHIDFGIVAASRLFHLGYPTVMKALYRNKGAKLVEIFRRAKKSGVTTSLDLAMLDPRSEESRIDWRAIFRKLLPYVDLLLPSVEESLFCMYPEPYRVLREKVSGDLIEHIESDLFSRIAGEFLDFGCGVCMLKAGHQGIYIRTAKAERLRQFGPAAPVEPESWAELELWCPAFEVSRIVSATGAGDVSISAFLGGLLAGWPVERCLKAAALAGYLNLQTVDSFSGLKSLEECGRLLDSSELPVKKLDRKLGSGWNFDKEEKLYRRKS